MGIDVLIAFATGMFLLALSPGPGLAAVLSRSLVSGMRSGSMVVLGMVLIDYLFLGLAIIGLSAVATFLGPLFQIIKYASALYLIWLGYKYIQTANKEILLKSGKATSYLKDVGLGAVVTLGNPKAILFYGAFLPTFFDIPRIGFQEYLIICGIITAISVIVYGIYMIFAQKSLGLSASHRLTKRINQTAGAMFVGSGVVIALK